MERSPINDKLFGSYPPFGQGIEEGGSWIGGENEFDRSATECLSRFVLFRRGQFVHNFSDLQAGKTHVLTVLDRVTQIMELAALMCVKLSTDLAISIELHNVDGHQLTWPADRGNRVDLVASDRWCQNKDFSVARQHKCDDQAFDARNAAIAVALEIFAELGWTDPPVKRLREEQSKRFG